MATPKNRPRYSAVLKNILSDFEVATAMTESSSRSYWGRGERFLKNVRPRFYKVGGKTYLVDLRSNKYDSPFSIAISISAPGKNSAVSEKKIFEAPIAFRNNGVVIKTFQGARGVSGEIRDLERAVRMPIANFLCSVIEEEARRLGFKYTYIMRPETSTWYSIPITDDEVKKSAAGRRMLKKSPTSLSPSESAELIRLGMEAVDRIRLRMRKIIEGVANSRNYTPFRNFFRKQVT